MKILKKEDYNTGELNLNTMERKQIIKCLKLCRGQKRAAATVLDITERTIHNKIEAHQIKKYEYIN
jgi:DNA-binding NtrC family response regulator